MTTTFETARCGDRVWCITSGWGEVRSIDPTKDYSIAVYFAEVDEFKTFTMGGLYEMGNLNQSLFWGEVEVVAPSKPLPDLEVDAKVLVWTDPAKKHRRHFSHFSGGQICTFDAGATSFSMLHRNSITCWPHWELAE